MKRTHETQEILSPIADTKCLTAADKKLKTNEITSTAAEVTDSEVEDEPSDSDSDNEARSNKRHLPRLGKCEVCASLDARYSCPKCEVKTCSLRCVQIHKKELECDGIRDRTKFIPLRKMTRMDFMNDYYFLEECTRYVEDRKNDKLKRFTRYNKTLPTHLYRLRGAAAERKTALRFLLPNFTRHKSNTTYYDWKLRKICWRIEWIFMNAGGLQYVDERCDEDVPLAHLLDKYVNVKNVKAVPQKKLLEYYQSVGVYGLKLLLKAEGIKCSRTRYHVLDARKTLKANLAGKTLVEFPCIYVSYEQQPTGCDIIDSDEDVEAETKHHEAAMEALRQERLAAAAAAKSNNHADEVESAAAKEAKKLAEILAEKKREARARKREEFEKAPSNFLFSDEQLWEMLSSSASSGDETEEEQGGSKS